MNTRNSLMLFCWTFLAHTLLPFSYSKYCCFFTFKIFIRLIVGVKNWFFMFTLDDRRLPFSFFGKTQFIGKPNNARRSKLVSLMLVNLENMLWSWSDPSKFPNEADYVRLRDDPTHNLILLFRTRLVRKLDKIFIPLGKHCFQEISTRNS